MSKRYAVGRVVRPVLFFVFGQRVALSGSERVGVVGERSVGRRIIAIITASPIPSLVSF